MWKEFWKILPDSLKEGLTDAHKSYRLYWTSYGGFAALQRSPYLYVSLIFTLLIVIWGDSSWDWAADVKTIIACTLGFSFAGYSLMLGMADGKFLKMIKGEFLDGKPSPLLAVAAAFTHFFIVQCTALLFGIIARAFGAQNQGLIRLVGIFLLIYAIFVLLAAALAALNFISWYNNYTDDD